MPTSETITISLTPELAEFVRGVVESDDYPSASAAIDDAVRAWKDRTDRLGYGVDELRAFVREGLESGPGRHASMAAIKAEARRLFTMTSSGD